MLVASALSVVPAAFLTTPMDVIKTRIQATPITTDNWKLNKQLKYRNIAECIAKIYKKEGMKAFFKGSALRVIYWVPQFTVSLLAYETIVSGFELDDASMILPPTFVPVFKNEVRHIRAHDSSATKIHNMKKDLFVWR